MALSLKACASPLGQTSEQLRILGRANGIPPFEEKMHKAGLDPLCAIGITVFQINVGKLCNQTCHHCHVDAGPDRKEVMTRETAELCIRALAKTQIPNVDVTGGAPELNPNFRWLVQRAVALGRHVIDRCNLSVLLLPAQADLANFLSQNGVEVIASLPYFREAQTDAQRGSGVFAKSISALRKLNELGYGQPGSGLLLNLVHNPVGAFLPPKQQAIEAQFRRELERRHGVVFNNLYTITNMPIGRFLEFLLASGNYCGYMQRLANAFNPVAAAGVMCRYIISVGWDGALYDCDFNQMLSLPLGFGSPQHVRDFDAALLFERRIATRNHCYGCTAGPGSSCGGSITWPLTRIPKSGGACLYGREEHPSPGSLRSPPSPHGRGPLSQSFPSPQGRGWPAAGGFTSRSGPGEGSLRKGTRSEPKMRIPNREALVGSWSRGFHAILFSLGAILVLALSSSGAEKKAMSQKQVEEAKKFIEAAEAKLLEVNVEASRADWVKATYITEDTEMLAAQADERAINATVELAKQATRFDHLRLPEDVARKMKLLKLSLTLATPPDPKESAELTQIVSGLEGTYGKGKWCPPGKDKCLDIEDITRVMANSRDPKELRDAWVGWHAISRPMRKDFVRYVELANKGARELGFQDNGAMWRSKYDMSPEEFAQELDRLWEQVRPLYVALHAYVRNRLREKYGDAVVPANGPIPSHLLGNLWAQEWGNIYPLVAPQNADPGYDLTAILKGRNTDAKQMVRYGERFFTSLGFVSLPETFWQRSLFVKPQDRDVVCHASAWDVDFINDLRVKMCIDITGEYFSIIHHELGHNFYQRAYNTQPFLFRDSANDGFHEAVGDTIALSVTPQYLVQIGLLDKAPDPSKDMGFLLNKALEKIAFLPFGLLIDQWRWKVFSGQIPPEKYNQTWWELKLKYQGVAPPAQRGEEDFDPGAKYHVAANVPYMRYFLADILQFQFHRALAQAAGCKEPLHRCSIYGNKEAGKRLNAMLEMGLSRPWPEALDAITGQRQMDATAIRDYFAPLERWLNEQNQGKPVGW